MKVPLGVLSAVNDSTLSVCDLFFYFCRRRLLCFRYVLQNKIDNRIRIVPYPVTYERDERSGLVAQCDVTSVRVTTVIIVRFIERIVKKDVRIILTYIVGNINL